MTMWSTLEKFKDNITQIASDVLITQEELETQSLEGPVGDFDGFSRLRPSNIHDKDDVDPMAEELEFYKSEYYRLQSAQMQIQADLSTKHVDPLKENESYGQLDLQINFCYAECQDNHDAGVQEPEEQVTEKDQALLLKEAHNKALAALESLEERLKNEKALVVGTNTQLQKTRKELECATNKINVLQTERQELDFELAQLQKKPNDQDGLMENFVQELQRTIGKLELEKSELQAGMEGLQQSLEAQILETDRSPRIEEEGFVSNLLPHVQVLDQRAQDEQVNSLSQRLREAEESLTHHRLKCEERLEEVSQERDKALSDLQRLRKNLMDMESSTSDKMEQDSMRLADVEKQLQTSEEHISALQLALNQALEDLAEARKCSTEGLGRASEETQILNLRLESCLAALESKDKELLNLQSALGQYYAESDAQERLQRELSTLENSNARLAEDLRIANGSVEFKSQEGNVAMEKLASAMIEKEEFKQITQNLEEEVLRLRRALQQSITSLNHMSYDSDYYVDRRIVIKLLVTYFQRHYSREVLDLMARMLGFSEEEKHQVRLAQESARGGVVRGVFSLPGRLVGGIPYTAASHESPLPARIENQSFADMWIDFLLKESEEREKRERKATSSSSTLSPLNGVVSSPSSPA